MTKSIKHALPHRWVKQEVTVTVTTYPFADFKAVKDQLVFVEIKGLGKNRVQGIGRITAVGELEDVRSSNDQEELISTYYMANSNVDRKVCPQPKAELEIPEDKEDDDYDEDSNEE